MSKGSTRRPQKITEEEMQRNWERAFDRQIDFTGSQLKRKSIQRRHNHAK